MWYAVGFTVLGFVLLCASAAVVGVHARDERHRFDAEVKNYEPKHAISHARLVAGHPDHLGDPHSVQGSEGPAPNTPGADPRATVAGHDGNGGSRTVRLTDTGELRAAGEAYRAAMITGEAAWRAKAGLL